MPSTPPIDLQITEQAAGRIAHLAVHSGKLNILDSAVIAEFTAAVDGLASDEALRALVITGGGERAFIGGANIHEMAALDAAGAEAFISRLQRLCAALRNLPVPVIARVNGYALGAGLEIAAACDLRIASREAVFGMPEVRVGIPSVIEAALLPSLIGWGRTRELLLLGETIDADIALSWGLVERVAAPAELDAAVNQCLRALLAAGPQAIRLQKALIRQWEDLPLREAIAAGIKSFAQAYASDEPARMMGAFINRKR
jgi:enoyl-CoA hydratase/carnithine racemase